MSGRTNDSNTRFRVLAILVAVFLSGHTACVASIEEQLQSVGRVVCFEESGGELQPVSHGSGFVVDDDGHLVTNHHVIDGTCDKLMVFFDREDHSDLRIITADPRRDLAVLKMDGAERPPLPIYVGTGRELDVQLKVNTLGFPGSADAPVAVDVFTYCQAVANGESTTPTTSPGSMKPKPVEDTFVNAVRENNRDVIMLDRSVRAGNSGGPVVDLCGHVVGVAAFGTGSGFEEVSWAVDASELRDMLDSHGVDATFVNKPCKLGSGSGASGVPPWYFAVIFAVGLAGFASVVLIRKPGLLKRDRPKPVLRGDPPAPPPSTPSPFALVFEGRPLGGAVVELGSETLVIGRDPGVCDVVAAEGRATAGGSTPKVARKHVQVRWRGDAVEVRDVFSNRGISIAGSRPRPGDWTVVQPGQTIRLVGSDVVFTIRRQTQG